MSVLDIILSMFRDWTSKGFLLSKIFTGPFWGIFLLTQVLLYKECGATPLQISLIVALKPICGIFSALWSHIQSHRIVSRLLLAQFLKFTPFLLFPFISSNWWIITSFAVHMILARGVMPAWMELLKADKSSSARICAVGGNIDYIATTFLPLIYGSLLDHAPGTWRWLFFSTACLSLVSLFFILKLPKHKEIPFQMGKGFASWKSLKELFLKRPDFRQFQLGFFLGGAGLMVMQPALPVYFIEVLNLSYTEIFLAIATCKGLGFIGSSSLWAKSLHKYPIFQICGWVTMVASFFPLLLFCAHWNLSLMYFAYLIYGIMQGGSELCWKMSGPLFSKEENSTPYSTINLLMVGVRGLIFPFVGGWLCNFGGPTYPLVVGGGLCLASAAYLTLVRRKMGFELQT